jgi:uncharacterized integral membrane protein
VFYLVLSLLILLCLVAIAIVYQNFAVLSSDIHLTFAIWHLPGIPVLLLCLFFAFIGGLLLYVIASFGARRDAQEMEKLRARIEELTRPSAKSPNGGLANFASPVVPMPGFSPAGSLSQRQQPSPPQAPTPSGPLAPSGPLINPPQPGRPGFPPQPPQTGAQRPPFFQP